MYETGRVWSTIADLLRRFAQDRQGATATEYAMLASGVGVVLAALIFGLGARLKTGFYEEVSNMF